MTEIFKEIPEYNGHYLISNLGRVKSVPRKAYMGTRFKERILKLDTRKCENGAVYLRATLSLKGKTKKYQVHRLVAQAFIPNPENKAMVNHIDNNPSNNHVSNLEWCTHEENMEHSAKQGRQDKVKQLGGEALAKINQEKAETKYSSLLEDAYISTNVPIKKGKRRVTYRCRGCLNIMTQNAETIAVQTGDAVCGGCRVRLKI